MSFSLINAQMTRVISSPSNSTTGLATLIFCPLVRVDRKWARGKEEEGEERRNEEVGR